MSRQPFGALLADVLKHSERLPLYGNHRATLKADDEQRRAQHRQREHDHDPVMLLPGEERHRRPQLSCIPRAHGSSEATQYNPPTLTPPDLWRSGSRRTPLLLTRHSDVRCLRFSAACAFSRFVRPQLRPQGGFESVAGGRVAVRLGNAMDQSVETQRPKVVGHLRRAVGAAEQRSQVWAEVAIAESTRQMREGADRLEQRHDAGVTKAQGGDALAV